MKDIARLPEKDRSELFQATAVKRGLPSYVIEKDFWVCFMLDHLFHDCKYKDKFVFKGGTSLSKAAHYETATLKNIVLVPNKTVSTELEKDYTAMQNLIYGDIPEFEEILEFLNELQEEIHSL